MRGVVGDSAGFDVGDIIQLGWHAGAAMGRLLNTLQLDGLLTKKNESLA